MPYSASSIAQHSHTIQCYKCSTARLTPVTNVIKSESIQQSEILYNADASFNLKEFNPGCMEVALSIWKLQADNYISSTGQQSYVNSCYIRLQSINFSMSQILFSSHLRNLRFSNQCVQYQQDNLEQQFEVITSSITFKLSIFFLLRNTTSFYTDTEFIINISDTKTLIQVLTSRHLVAVETLQDESRTQGGRHGLGYRRLLSFSSGKDPLHHLSWHQTPRLGKRILPRQTLQLIKTRTFHYSALVLIRLKVFGLILKF